MLLPESEARTKPNEAQKKFLAALMRWQGVASPQDLGPQTSQKENAARQTCKRRGWVTFTDGYWRMTESGRTIFRADKPEGGT